MHCILSLYIVQCFFFFKFLISNVFLSLDQEGMHKLGTILAFATGANTVPPIGFSPPPSVEFLHQEHDAGSISKLPIANTCINCLKLPLHTSYRDFQENMDFALGNTHGFGIA